MSQETHLLKAAIELAKVLNSKVDDQLPQRLAGIVKTHAALAVGTALIPVPGADIAASAANVWTMYVRINKELDLPFADNIVKSVAAGVVTNIGAAAASLLIVASAVKFVPGLGSLGGALLMMSTVYAVSLAAGVVYMKAVARLLRSKSAGDISEADIKAATDEVAADKDALEEVIEEAKRDYKRNKGKE